MSDVRQNRACVRQDKMLKYVKMYGTTDDRKSSHSIFREVFMFRFAFFINAPGTSPETYSKVFENEECYGLVAGVDGTDAAKQYAARLEGDGFMALDLSGDFSDEAAEEISEAAGDSIRVRKAQYTINGITRLSRLNSFKEYGVIIKVDGLEKPRGVMMKSEKKCTTVIFVNDMDQAKKAAVKLVAMRVSYIELCSWFDQLMMESLDRLINSAVPIGTCGTVYLNR